MGAVRVWVGTTCVNTEDVSVARTAIGPKQLQKASVAMR